MRTARKACVLLATAATRYAIAQLEAIIRDFPESLEWPVSTRHTGNFTSFDGYGISTLLITTCLFVITQPGKSICAALVEVGES
jgi:hypothetical protein